MTAQDLKNSILQLAIQGKLVEQRADEGTAKELVEQIKAEKEQLIKEKKIKKEKPLPQIAEDEIPFEIPESWEWVRLGNIINKLTDGTHSTPNYTAEGIPFLSVKDISTGIIDFSNTKFISEDEHKLLYSRCNPELGDILLTKIGTTGVPVIIETDITFSLFVSVALLKFSKELVYDKYLLYTIQSPVVQVQCDTNTRGVGNKNWVMRDIANTIMPLPPLEEQQRIVAKIEELLPYIEQYDKAYSKLEVFNKKFPEDMQKSILQYAIQGKLVEQRPEEGTAEELYQQIQEEKERLIKEGKIKKEKPLSEITEDEIPFEIPESWKWVKLGELCEKIGSGSTPTGGRNVYKESGIKFLRSQNIYNDGLRMDGIAFISEEQNRQGSVVKAKDILLNITGGSIGRCALIPDDFDTANINQHVMIIRNVNAGLRFYLHLVLISPYIQSLIMNVQVGVSREGLSAEKLKNFVIPLPPVSEQHRIVEALEEYLPYCTQLIK